MSKKGTLLIGTSGWVYEHWRGVFYPEDMRESEWLGFYMKHFDTVEINNTFYHLPSKNSFISWHRCAKKGFVYALKVSRYITHMRKLLEPEKPLSLFMERATLLKENLGPLLFQLPPRWRVNPERLKEFTEKLPQGIRAVFEFRDQSWFCEAVYKILKQKGIALCLYHMPGFTTPAAITAGFVYIRFHGSGTLYGGRYEREFLKKWAKTISGFIKDGLDVYVYFNNDAMGNAVINARELKELC